MIGEVMTHYDTTDDSYSFPTGRRIARRRVATLSCVHLARIHLTKYSFFITPFLDQTGPH